MFFFGPTVHLLVVDHAILLDRQIFVVLVFLLLGRQVFVVSFCHSLKFCLFKYIICGVVLLGPVFLLLVFALAVLLDHQIFVVLVFILLGREIFVVLSTAAATTIKKQ
ncbi:hypothetical protein T12_9254 [Trichinella patagoniensis]|uniref:Uncharacterized protein n=1 Tax=Trichinella patagoniensis TaxID=990121 RepID=A0A0V0Z804_9BILA|nr:hypothetical protein T12_9254 [Trichinella patagoniensis]